MFFIFGWGRQTLKNEGPVMKYQCEHCKNSEFWELYTRKTWFTLFFIPLIPYSTEHLLLCPVCKYGFVIDNAKYKELKAIVECNSELMNKNITQEEHLNRIRHLTIGQSNNSNDDGEVSLKGKTQTQLNYIKQMRELEKERENRSK